MKSTIFVAMLFLLAPALWAQGANPFVKARLDLKPRLVSFAGKFAIADALETLYQKTGNRVHDRRGAGTLQTATLELKEATFWQAVDALSAALGCTISPYHDDGIHLVEGERSPTVHYEGIFRFVFRRVSVVRDETRSWCQLTVEMMWEPRLEPLYYGPTAVHAEFSGAAKGAKLTQADRPELAGKRSVELEFRLPAPPRSSPSIALLQGNVTILAPSQMLEFTFENLKAIKKGDPPQKQEREGVSVTLAKILSLSQNWQVEVQIEDPPIEGKSLDSYQSRFRNNRLTLRRIIDGKAEELAATVGQTPTEPARPAILSYSFRSAEVKTLADWTLVCRTPGPILEWTVPFRFENIPLP